MRAMSVIAATDDPDAIFGRCGVEGGRRRGRVCEGLCETRRERERVRGQVGKGGLICVK